MGQTTDRHAQAGRGLSAAFFLGAPARARTAKSRAQKSPRRPDTIDAKRSCGTHHCRCLARAFPDPATQSHLAPRPARRLKKLTRHEYSHTRIEIEMPARDRASLGELPGLYPFPCLH